MIRTFEHFGWIIDGLNNHLFGQIIKLSTSMFVGCLRFELKYLILFCKIQFINSKDWTIAVIHSYYSFFDQSEIGNPKFWRIRTHCFNYIKQRCPGKWSQIFLITFFYNFTIPFCSSQNNFRANYQCQKQGKVVENAVNSRKRIYRDKNLEQSEDEMKSDEMCVNNDEYHVRLISTTTKSKSKK